MASFGAVLENKFGNDVVDVGREIRGSNGKRIGEIDIVLKFANVEVKSGARPVDMNQLQTLTTNTTVKPGGLPVVVYAPQATLNQMKQIQSAGATPVRDTADLIRTLEKLKKEREP